jgi:hypothetical protein
MYYTAIAYRGTAGRSDWHYSYSKPEHRAEKIKEFFDGLSRAAAYRAERKAQRTNPAEELAKASPDKPVSLSTAATAVCVRKALKTAFPHTTFSVKSSEYSMGSSIDVRWIDGPTGKQVEPILDAFEGAGFDGMNDCKTYLGPSEYEGKRVSWGADYVHGSRSESAWTLREAARRVAAECSLPELEVTEDNGYPHVKEGGYGVNWSTYVKDDGTLGLAHNAHRQEQHSQLVYQVARFISYEQTQAIELPKRIEREPAPPAPHQETPAYKALKARDPQPGEPAYQELLNKIRAIQSAIPASRLVN